MVEFTSILHAVKPRQRTTLYKVLAALCALGADSSPVTTAELRALMEMHLNRSVPKNLVAKLRKYNLYVRKAQKGPPIKWLLTQKGKEKIEQLTALPLFQKGRGDAFGIDVGIVCALEQPEFSAVVEAAGGPAKWREVGTPSFTHVYREATLKTASGKSLKVVGVTSSSMGLTAASIVTTQLIMQFKPRIVMMIGIAAGTKDGGKQFGDVLVADPSVDYNSGKVIRERGIRAFLPDPYPIGLNARLRSVLLKHRGANNLFAEIRARWNGRLPPTENRLHVGPLGAADQVIDDAERVVEIQRNWRKLIGVEMETYGVYRACHEAPEPKPRFISFKAVCDFAAHKSDSWQEYAAFVAAEFAIRFVQMEWDSLWAKLGEDNG